MGFFRIELISEKPKSKETKKTETIKECTNEHNYRNGECNYMACPIYHKTDDWKTKHGQCNYRSKTETKVVEGGMKELVKFIKENGLGKDGKRLSDEEVADIVENLNKEDAEEQTEINRKLGEDEKEAWKTYDEKLNEDCEDDDAWLEYYGEKEGMKCGNCGAEHTKEEAEIGYCWYCGAKLNKYNEDDISDELIQYTVIHKDGRTEHKWLTQKEYDDLWNTDKDIVEIIGEK